MFTHRLGVTAFDGTALGTLETLYCLLAGTMVVVVIMKQYKSNNADLLVLHFSHKSSLESCRILVISRDRDRTEPEDFRGTEAGEMPP
jgi:hypothetical protein